MKKIISATNVSELLGNLTEEFAVIKNPDYIHPEFELAPLAKKLTAPINHLAAAVMDMDGTTTTTEELCIHSLEYMIRKMSGKLTTESWIGLDHIQDYPNIIGNSTTKHVEYLLNKYSALVSTENIHRSFLFAAVWTLLAGSDEQRKDEVKINLINLHIYEITADSYFKELSKNPSAITKNEADITNYFYEKYVSKFNSLSKSDLVKIGIDIYYQRYHEILQRIQKGESKLISTEIFNNPDKHLILPMPGILSFLCLIKGWLGNEAGNITDTLLKEFHTKSGNEFSSRDKESIKQSLIKLGIHFEQSPAKAAIVTSSIYYEANIVMNEVFSVLTEQLINLPISESRKNVIAKKLQHYENVYDAFITASDSTEIRLKPHRDLYSIALHRLNIPKSEFGSVIGFEDSESGTIAIRAAGIGRCIAVPFAQTSGHNFEAATIIAKGGVPEIILEHNIFFNN